MVKYLSVAILGPSKIKVNEETEYTLQITNGTDEVAYNVKAYITVSNGLQLTTGQTIDIGTINPGETKQAAFKVVGVSIVVGWIHAIVQASSNTTTTHTGEATLYVTVGAAVETNWNVYVPDTGVAVRKWIKLTPSMIEQVLERARNNYYARLTTFIAHINIEGEDYDFLLSRRSLRLVGRAGLDPEYVAKLVEFLELPQPLGQPVVVGSIFEWATLADTWIFRQPWTGVAMVVYGYFPEEVIESKWDKVKQNGGELLGFIANCWLQAPGPNVAPDFILHCYPNQLRVVGRRAKETDLLADIEDKLLSGLVVSP